MVLTGATGCSTCHTRGSPRPVVRSGLGTERFQREERQKRDKEEEGGGGVVGVKFNKRSIRK